MLYYDRYAKIFRDAENTERNYIRIKTRTGHFNIDISEFLPATTPKFKMLLDIIAEDVEHEKELVNVLSGFISEAIELLTRFRDHENAASEKAKYNGQLKKWIKLHNEIAGRYSLEEKADAETSVKCKKITVVPFAHMTGNEKPRLLDGWKFEKYGMQFYAYKNTWQKIWHIIAPCVGLSCVQGASNKNAAIASITPETIEQIKKIFSNAEKLEEMRNRYADYLEKYGFSYLLEDPIYDIPEYEAAESVKPEAITETPEEAAKATITEETPEAVQAPETAYNGNINLFSAVYSRVYNTLYNHLERSIPAQRIFYRKAVSYFDDVLNLHSNGLLSAFIRYRHDFISSDREAAAFTIAYWLENGGAENMPPDLLRLFMPAEKPSGNALNRHILSYNTLCNNQQAASRKDPYKAIVKPYNASETFSYKDRERRYTGSAVALHSFIGSAAKYKRIPVLLPAAASSIPWKSGATQCGYIDSS